MRPPGAQKVIGSNPVGTQIFSRSHVPVTIFHISHIFTELQFHHHSFIIDTLFEAPTLNRIPYEREKKAKIDAHGSNLLIFSLIFKCFNTLFSSNRSFL